MQSTIPIIKEIEYPQSVSIEDYFSDHKQGEIDLAPYLWGEAFEALKQIHGTLTWPNGVDIAPEQLYEEVG